VLSADPALVDHRERVVERGERKALAPDAAAKGFGRFEGQLAGRERPSVSTTRCSCAGVATRRRCLEGGAEAAEVAFQKRQSGRHCVTAESGQHPRFAFGHEASASRR
jgi:hypothetical protein